MEDYNNKKSASITDAANNNFDIAEIAREEAETVPVYDAKYTGILSASHNIWLNGK